MKSGLLIQGPRFPFRSKRVADVDERGVEVGLGREARGIEPSVPVYGLESGGGGRIRRKVINEILLKLLGVEGFAGKGCEILILGKGRGQNKESKEPGGREKLYMRNKLIPFLLAEHFLQIVKEGEAFLVRNAGEGVVGVFTGQVDDQFREFMGLSKLSYRL